jgi:hypothetical protein
MRVPRFVDLDALPDSFAFQEGFSRPDWKRIWAAVERVATPAQWHDAWQEIAIQWVKRLQSELGGGYVPTLSPNFILLSELSPGEVRRLGSHAEQVSEVVRGQLGWATRRDVYGPGAILLFTDEDDYYQYVSYYYPEGLHPTSVGCMIPDWYLHLAVQTRGGMALSDVLSHELAHLALAHLPLPRWLDEGYATSVEQRLGSMPNRFLDRELRARHLAFWDSQRLQEFWAGTSFAVPGESNELSYSLAEILVNFLAREPQAFMDFVGHAQRDDGGQTAALDCLGAGLGDVVETFLGEGDWRPYRHRMVECWRNAGWHREQSTAEAGGAG